MHHWQSLSTLGVPPDTGQTPPALPYAAHLQNALLAAALPWDDPCKFNSFATKASCPLDSQRRFHGHDHKTASGARSSSGMAADTATACGSLSQGVGLKSSVPSVGYTFTGQPSGSSSVMLAPSGISDACVLRPAPTMRPHPLRVPSVGGSDSNVSNQDSYLQKLLGARNLPAPGLKQASQTPSGIFSASDTSGVETRGFPTASGSIQTWFPDTASLPFFPAARRKDQHDETSLTPTLVKKRLGERSFFAIRSLMLQQQELLLQQVWDLHRLCNAQEHLWLLAQSSEQQLSDKFTADEELLKTTEQELQKKKLALRQFFEAMHTMLYLPASIRSVLKTERSAAGADTAVKAPMSDGNVIKPTARHVQANLGNPLYHWGNGSGSGLLPESKAGKEPRFPLVNPDKAASQHKVAHGDSSLQPCSQASYAAAPLMNPMFANFAADEMSHMGSAMAQNVAQFNPHLSWYSKHYNTDPFRNNALPNNPAGSHTAMPWMADNRGCCWWPESMMPFPAPGVASLLAQTHAAANSPGGGASRSKGVEVTSNSKDGTQQRRSHRRARGDSGEPRTMSKLQRTSNARQPSQMPEGGASSWQMCSERRADKADPAVEGGEARVNANRKSDAAIGEYTKSDNSASSTGNPGTTDRRQPSGSKAT